MANDLNRCAFIGHLGADPELRYTAAGTPVANFNIAANREWKDKDSGEKQQVAEWIRIVAFARLGEVCGEYLHKGSRVYIAGRLQTRKWQDQAGSDRYTSEIVANELQMLDAKPAGNRPPPHGEYSQPPQATSQQYRNASQGGGYPQQHGPGEHGSTTSAGETDPGFDDDLDDEIPF
jgi:single-strand DNA-binding protein